MASFLKPFRLGFGNKPESSGAEKPLLPKIEFWENGSVFWIEYDGTDANVYRDGVFLGTLPGSGGGGGPSAARFTVGAVDGNGPILPTNTVYWAQVERDVTLSGNWTLMVSPSSSVTIDIRLASFPTIPTSGDSITGGNAPAVVADSDATGDYTGWTTTTLTRGQVIAAVITANTGCRYIDLMLEAS